MAPLPARVLIIIQAMESKRERERRGLSPVKTEYDDSAIADHEDELAKVIGISVRHLRRILRKLEEANMVRLVSFEVGKRGRPKLEVRPTLLGYTIAKTINELNNFIWITFYGDGELHDRAVELLLQNAEEQGEAVKQHIIFNQPINDRRAKKLMRGAWLMMPSGAGASVSVPDIRKKMISGIWTYRMPCSDRDYECPNKECSQCKYRDMRRVIAFKDEHSLQSIGVFCFFGRLKSDLHINPRLYYANVLNQMLTEKGAAEEVRHSILRTLGMSREVLISPRKPR
jgi:DNA-binding Lrp family transcriptional regulator